MAQKVDHSALWMYVPNAGGVGVPTYFKPTERDGATVGKHPGPWLVGGGLTNMLLTPHEGEGDDDLPVNIVFNTIPLTYSADDLELGGTTFSDALKLEVDFTNTEPNEVTVGYTLPADRVIPASIPGWSGSVEAGFSVSTPSEDSWPSPPFTDEQFDLDVWITATGEDSLDGKTLNLTIPAGLIFAGERTSSQIVLEIPISEGL